MKWLGKDRFRLPEGQRGISLIETVVAIGILAAIGVVFLSALFSTSRGTGLHEQRVTALNLAQSQLELIRQAAYDNVTPYYDNVTLATPPGYAILVSTVPRGATAVSQNITVKVWKGEHFLLELMTIKTKW